MSHIFYASGNTPFTYWVLISLGIFSTFDSNDLVSTSSLPISMRKYVGLLISTTFSANKNSSIINLGEFAEILSSNCICYSLAFSRWIFSAYFAANSERLAMTLKPSLMWFLTYSSLASLINVFCFSFMSKTIFVASFRIELTKKKLL